jgi:hypothetical protein
MEYHLPPHNPVIGALTRYYPPGQWDLGLTKGRGDHSLGWEILSRPVTLTCFIGKIKPYWHLELEGLEERTLEAVLKRKRGPLTESFRCYDMGKCDSHLAFGIFPPEGGVDLVPKRGCLLTLTYYAFPRWCEFGERRWSDMLTGENRRTRRKTCPSATLSTTNLTWIDQARNLASAVRGRRLTTWAMARSFGMLHLNNWNKALAYLNIYAETKLKFWQ